MRDIVYLAFNRKNVIKMLKTKPTNEHFIKLNVNIDDKYFQKNMLETTLKVDGNKKISLQEFEFQLKQIKKGLETEK